jgi:tripartite-type tricarboxylate transporter receptor subunit TctC
MSYSLARIRAALFIALTLPVVGAYAQSTYPAKPVRIIVPFPPAGNTDVYARPIARKMTEIYGQQMIIDNRPGAGGSIGMELAVKSPPDGYTLVWGSTSTHGVGPNVYKKLPYDPVNDFEPVILAVLAQNILVVHPSVPAKSVNDLIRIAKAKKSGLSFASSGNGTISHLAGELFNTMAGTDMVHVPYKGSAPAMVDVIAGQVDVMFDSLASSVPQIRAGKLRAIAVTGEKRFASMSNVPTISESGLKGFDVSTWLAIWAPRKTPPEIVNRLNADIDKALHQPDILKLMAENGAEPGGGPPQRLDKHVKNEIAKWGKVVKAARLTIE